MLIFRLRNCMCASRCSELIARQLPLLITKHNDERFCDAPGKEVLGRWVARRADRLITISDAVKRYMCGLGLGVEERKLQTIYYGIDAARFGQSPRAQAASLRKHWGIAAEELAIGFVGRLVPQKDIGTLIRGFALFAATFAHAKLVIVGSGPLEEELRRSAEELGISDRVVWAGFRDDIVTVMSAFDIFALTSIYEGLRTGVAGGDGVAPTGGGHACRGDRGSRGRRRDWHPGCSAATEGIGGRFPQTKRRPSAGAVRRSGSRKSDAGIHPRKDVPGNRRAVCALHARRNLSRTKEQIACAVSTVN